jgi:UDP-N-acetylmuramoyl-tripeptide--D-alanyl-D-alanine ligase
MIWVLAAVCGVASIPAGLRWLRIAQREHYLAPSVSRFAWRWWTTGSSNLGLSALGLVGIIGTFWNLWLGFLVAITQIGPVGLGIKGKTSPLVWTGRLKRVAFVSGIILVGIYYFGGRSGTPVMIVVGLFALPLIVDFALLALKPLEGLLGSKWVAKAGRKLEAVRAEVVAITGSYGKTTTKNYVAHLLDGTKRTVVSPASYNNRMGLARAINESLSPGTEVFVAEMGTYGPGEIAKLCEWIPPRVAAIVAIGPVHLERFRTEERIVSAKAEILEEAEVGVICVDHPLLAQLAKEKAGSMSIIEVSTGDHARVVVADGSIRLDGRVIASAIDDVFPANLAVAIGICLALGVDVESLVERSARLPTTDHRQTVTVSESGFSIVDDTFNSNPTGAKRALELLQNVGSGGKLAVVTPGMVELGPVQKKENKAFASAVAGVVDHFIIVGKTNRGALVQGSANGRASVTVVDDREEAVAWIRGTLGPGDAVLYENDLPDHYP